MQDYLPARTIAGRPCETAVRVPATVFAQRYCLGEEIIVPINGLALKRADAGDPGTQPDDQRSGRMAETAIYHDLARIIERMHRRFLDVVRVELGRVGIDDISPVQVLMLMNIGTEELSVRDLMERGYYLGSNASYNLKQLVETGYVDRAPSLRDRRSARLRLSEKGMHLCAQLRRLEATQADVLIRTGDDNADFDTTYRTLRRLERAWSDIIRYDGRDFE